MKISSQKKIILLNLMIFNFLSRYVLAFDRFWMKH